MWAIHDYLMKEIISEVFVVNKIVFFSNQSTGCTEYLVERPICNTDLILTWDFIKFVNLRCYTCTRTCKLQQPSTLLFTMSTVMNSNLII